MEQKIIKCGNLSISNSKPLVLIAGPCQLENEKHAMDIAEELKSMTQKLGIGLIYKTSFDKANRTSLKGQRGTGLENSLPVFDKIHRTNRDKSGENCFVQVFQAHHLRKYPRWPCGSFWYRLKLWVPKLDRFR